MLSQQSRPASFRNCYVDQRHDGPAQIENSSKVSWPERQSCQQWPVQDFLNVQHRQTKPLASAAENAILRLRQPLFHRSKSFKQVVRIRGKRYQVKIFAHRRIILESSSRQIAVQLAATLPV